MALGLPPLEPALVETDWPGVVEQVRSRLTQRSLVVLLSAYVATLVWMRRMAIGKPLPRFLDARRAVA